MPSVSDLQPDAGAVAELRHSPLLQAASAVRFVSEMRGSRVRPRGNRCNA